MRVCFLLILLTLIIPLYSFNKVQAQDLIPMPVKAVYEKRAYRLPAKGIIKLTGDSIYPVADQYINSLAKQGLHYKLSGENVAKPIIHLIITTVPFLNSRNEAYQLMVNQSGITVRANNPHGLFNALQTLRQLISNGTVPYCDIKDEPAYQWRGYMIDVGRNYQPVSLIKEQIDAMALAKLNVFHFHATEHVAWRFESKLYPQLNKPQAMTRDKGRYYNEAELKDIIKYCKDRFIEFVPEIDMPGHSDAFTRAMGFGMQTEQGLAAVKKLVKEFADTYDFNYLHMGADEVKITMPSFMPEMIQYVKSLNKKIVAWWPGKITDKEIIRNLWFGDVGEKEESEHVPTVDARHTYLNHFDPLESVAALFFRRYNGVTMGSSQHIGATICVWPDRRIATPTDALKANAVYPAILAFAERTWRGGGIPQFIANIPAEPALRSEFFSFEKRLISVRNRFFNNHIFTYTPQADIKWDLFGPFDNKGNADATFPIENGFSSYKGSSLLTAYGGTVVLRHFWGPVVTGLLNQPKENSTIYARTKIWSDNARSGKFWISFNNISRSPAVDAPPPGKWNNNNGKVWVNDQLIPPPHWKYAGETGDAERPLSDEDYAYRVPTAIPLKKGWNEVWVKVPVTSFKGRDSQNPVKWMFTFAEVK